MNIGGFMTKVKDALGKELTKEGLPAEQVLWQAGLPKEAFAIVGDPDDPETWKLPHHTKAILRARGRLDIEKTVDWDRMPAAVAALSKGGHRGERGQGSAADIIKADRPLATHYEGA